MFTLTIKLPEEMKARLEIEAAQSGKSVSAVVREALFARLEQSRERTSLFERTQDLCGAGASGKPDLATNPEYLEGLGQ